MMMVANNHVGPVPLRYSTLQLIVILSHIKPIDVNFALRGISVVPSRYGKYLKKNLLRISLRSNAGLLLVKKIDATINGPTVGIPGRKTPIAAMPTNRTPNETNSALLTGLISRSGRFAVSNGSGVIDTTFDDSIY